MTILFSTTKPASPACQPPARIYFEAPDDALLARVTEKVAELMGRHLSYVFHDEAPGGVTPIILEDVGPSALPVETNVVNYPHAAGVVPGSLLLKEHLSGRILTDNGRGHLIDQDGRSAATVDYETGTIHQPQAMPDLSILAERGANAWTSLLAYVLQDELPNRLTPRVIDIAHTAFLQAKQPNDEDGGASDWFNDTRPMVRELIAKLRKDLIEELAGAPQPSPTPPTQAVEELIRLKAQAKQDEELILQLVETLESVDAAMPFPVAKQVLKVARARLDGKP